MFLRARTFKAPLLAGALALCCAAQAAAALNPFIAPQTASTTLSVGWFGSGNFNVALSTVANFSVRLSSGMVTGNSTNYFNLTIDATHYFRVKQAGAAEGSYEVVSVSTAPMAAPASPAFNPSKFSAKSSFTAVIGLGWNTAGNPDWTRYEVMFATASDYTGNAGTTPANLFTGDISVAGLDANTTYFLKVRAAGFRGSYSAWSADVSTATPALELQVLGDAVYQDSATISWGQIKDASVQALDSDGYRLVYSPSESLASPAQWSTAFDTQTYVSLTGLYRNTTYYYSVGAVNVAGAANFSDRRAFMTRPAALPALTRLYVDAGTAALGWAPLPLSPQDVAASGYRLELSTSASNWAGALSSSTYDMTTSSLALNTLDANTTYYFRGVTLNSAGGATYGPAASTVTLSLPVPAYLASVQAGAQAISVTYTPWPASPQAVACEGYRLEASTAPFGSGGAVRSSVTADGQLSRISVPGLAPNTSYYLRLGTLNWQNTPNYTDLPLALTLTGAAPQSPSPVTLSSAAAVIHFTPVPLEAPDGYIAEASTYSLFNQVYASAVSYDASTNTLTIENLQPNTLYYFRAGSLYNGATVYALTSPALAWTQPQPLGAAAHAGIWESSMSVSWSAMPDAAYFRVDAASAASFSNVLFFSSTTNQAATSLALTGLTPNTSYFLRAGAFNQAGAGTWATLPDTSTLASPPGWAAAAISSNSVTVNWTQGSNPADTRYLVELSSVASYTPASAVYSAVTTLASRAFSGLQPNTPHYSRVTAINRLDRPTPAVDFSSVATGALDPAGLTASSRWTSSVTVSWGDGGNLPGTWYTARLSDDPAFASGVVSSVTQNTSAAFAGLVSNASYYLNVSAMNLDLAPTSPAVSLGALITRPAEASVYTSLAAAFTNRLTDGFTFAWGRNGNWTQSAYNVEISTTQDFSVMWASAAVTGATSRAFASLPMNTTYWARVQTAGQDGSLTAFTSTGPVRTLSDATLSATSLTENVISLQTSYGAYTVRMPAGSLGGSTMLYLVPQSTFAAPASNVADLTPTGIGVTITKGSPVLVLGAITITVPYRPTELNTFDRTRLVLALYDEPSGAWIPLPSVSDTAARTITAKTWHLSTFQIMEAAPKAALSEIKVYPNPYRPNSVTDVMHFTNMPPYAKVEIYTFLGELVRKIKADLNGMAYWDGRNSAGEMAASGVYIARVRSGQKDKLVKIAMER